MFVMTSDSAMEHTGYIKAYKNHIIYFMTSAESRLTVVSREAKKKQHACTFSGLRDHYSELFTLMLLNVTSFYNIARYSSQIYVIMTIRSLEIFCQ